jgi:hypothetical protein
MPLFIGELLGGTCTRASELAMEKAEFWLIFHDIVTRGVIMHARKVLFIVFFCEV